MFPAVNDNAQGPERGLPPTTTIAALLALGLAMRLALLPVGAHPDLLSVYDRVRLVLSGSHDWSDFSIQALPMALHGLWAWITGVALPDMGGVNWPDPTELEVWREARRVLSVTSAGTLALWKLPYLLCDLAVGLVLTRLVPARRAAGVLALWACHPVLLYAIGLFAKYESFMLLPLVLGLLQLKRGRTGVGFLLFGVAIAMRLYPLLLLPAMVWCATPSTRRRLELAALAAAPLGVVLAGSSLAERTGLPLVAAWGVALVAAGAVGVAYLACSGRRLEPLVGAAVVLAAAWASPYVLETTFAADSSAWNALHHLRFVFGDLGAQRMDGLWWFGLAWSAVVIGAGLRARRRTDVASAAEDVLDAALCAALVFFSLSLFHPQYAALLAVLVLARMHRLPSGSAIHALQLLGLGVLAMHPAFLSGSTTVRLLVPLAPDPVLGLPDPRDLFPPALAALPWPAAGRALMLVAAGWTVFEILRSPRERDGHCARPLPLAAALATWPLAGLFYVRVVGRAAEAEGLESPLGPVLAEWGARLSPSGPVGAALAAALLIAVAAGVAGARSARSR